MDWETLKADCLACSRCELCKTRTNVVFGQGVLWQIKRQSGT